ncbi:maltose alpha-D-glucosyltransferase [Schaalia naturae]|uniref:Alpha-amylase n=1 Tax=Schaalia naturae TaxID=635203 RepID=A0ABW2SK88_9ACTO
MSTPSSSEAATAGAIPPVRVPEPAPPSGPRAGAAPLPPVAEDPQWYRRAVFYEVLVRAFADSDGDGLGDFRGLIGRLDYLQWLGVDALWIPPFFDSPMADGGYDISDYTRIDPRYGTMEDFRALVIEAHSRGIRIIVDMVLNHTSDQHPWFQASRQDPSGPYGDFYVWRDRPSEYLDARVIFVDTEDSNWAWDPVRQQFYWHRFFSHQPDLNFENPAVREAMRDVVRFWCSTGVDGFRLDAIPYLFEEDGSICENLPATHRYIASLREMVDREFPGTVMIAEANQPPHEVVAYFGTDEAPECHICFHFPVMPRIFAALREESSHGLREILAETPPLPQGGQWGTFLRNHDELTLEMVSDEERARMYQWYAPEPRMRANVGIRRRLMPLLEGSRREVELANALLLSLPGSPFLYYGDEIGMGEDIQLNDRDGVRTPMQWDATPSAGFSTADPRDLYLPIISNPTYDQRAVNVAEHRTRPTSMLNWTRLMLATRRAHPAFGIGSMTVLATSDDSVLAFLRRDESETILCVNNLATNPRAARIQLPGMAGWHLSDLATGNPFPDVREDETVDITLGRHGFYWLAVTFLEPHEEEQ